jgi:hypothetical protein
LLVEYHSGFAACSQGGNPAPPPVPAIPSPVTASPPCNYGVWQKVNLHAPVKLWPVGISHSS